MRTVPTTRPTAGRRRRPALAAVVTVLALLATLVPTAAHAADHVLGGTTRATAVPLPLRDLDGEFLGANIGATGGGRVWTAMRWYSWTATTTQAVYLRASSVDPVGWDNALEVWQGEELLVHNDDSYGLDAAVRVQFVAGRTYTIGLGAFNNGQGTARLTFSTRVPTPPRDVVVTPADRGLTVSWSEPEDVAGGVTGYVVSCAVGDAAPTPCASRTGTPPSRTAAVTGLTNGVPVTVTVTASNILGSSQVSTAVTVTPRTTSATTLSVDPAAPVSGEPFAVRAAVTVPSGTATPTGTVDLVVGGTTYAAVPLVDGVAVVEGLTAAAGPLAVAATYAGTPALVGSDAAATWTVERRTQSVTLDPLPDAPVYAGEPVTLVASATSGGPVTVTASGACTVEGVLLSFTDVGTCTVVAVQAGDSETLPASATATAEVGKRSQVLSVTAVPTLVHAQEPMPLVATSDAGLPVTVTAAGACALVDGTLVTTGVGPCTVTATQEGDARTVAAAPVVRTADVVRRGDVVTFDDVAAPALGAPTPLAASSAVGLPVALSAAGACALRDGALWALEAGDCVLTATTEGDELTEPATATLVVDVADVTADLRPVLAAQLGAPAAGADVFARASGLRPGTELTLTVHSTPRVVGTGVVGADGRVLVAGVLPADLELGAHRLVAAGTAFNGSAVASEVTFQVGPQGMLVRIGDSVLTPATVPASAAPAAAAPAAAALAVTGADAPGLLLQAVLWLLLGAAALVVARRRPAA